VAYRLILDGLPLFNSFLRLIVATVALYLLTGKYLLFLVLRCCLVVLLSWVVSNQINTTMTKTEFVSICAMLYVDPALALENDRVLEALRNGDGVSELEVIIEEEF